MAWSLTDLSKISEAVVFFLCFFQSNIQEQTHSYVTHFRRRYIVHQYMGRFRGL